MPKPLRVVFVSPSKTTFHRRLTIYRVYLLPEDESSFEKKKAHQSKRATLNDAVAKAKKCNSCWPESWNAFNIQAQSPGFPHTEIFHFQLLTLLTARCDNSHLIGYNLKIFSPCIITFGEAERINMQRLGCNYRLQYEKCGLRSAFSKYHVSQESQLLYLFLPSFQHPNSDSFSFYHYSGYQEPTIVQV